MDVEQLMVVLNMPHLVYAKLSLYKYQEGAEYIVAADSKPRHLKLKATFTFEPHVHTRMQLSVVQPLLSRSMEVPGMKLLYLRHCGNVGRITSSGYTPPVLF